MTSAVAIYKTGECVAAAKKLCDAQGMRTASHTTVLEVARMIAAADTEEQEGYVLLSDIITICEDALSFTEGGGPTKPPGYMQGMRETLTALIAALQRRV